MDKSMIADLQAELAQKRKRVEECEAALESERTAAEEYVKNKIGKAEAALGKAKREAESFVATVAQALGLPNPTAAREAKIRRKRVRELVAEGKTETEIAAELGVPLDTVTADVARLSQREKGNAEGDDGAELEEGQRGWKRDQVRRLMLEGKSQPEIAEKLGIPRTSVNAHVTQLRLKGKLPPAGAESRRGEHDDDADEEEEPVVHRSPPSTSAVPASVVGHSVEALRNEATRQQAGQRAKAVKLIAGVHNGHTHRVLVDRMGDGCTQSDDTGHVHKVYRFVVAVGAGHQHGLKVPTADELWA